MWVLINKHAWSQTNVLHLSLKSPVEYLETPTCSKIHFLFVHKPVSLTHQICLQHSNQGPIHAVKVPSLFSSNPYPPLTNGFLFSTQPPSLLNISPLWTQTQVLHLPDWSPVWYQVCLPCCTRYFHLSEGLFWSHKLAMAGWGLVHHQSLGVCSPLWSHSSRLQGLSPHSNTHDYLLV